MVMQQLAGVPVHLAGLLALTLLFGFPLAWRDAGPPERAAILTLVALAVMDVLIWYFAKGSALLHLSADALALSWLLPVALRANRFYPSVIVAALLVAVMAQILNFLVPAANAGTVEILVNALHLFAVLVYLCSAMNQRRMQSLGINRPAWRNRLPQG